MRTAKHPAAPGQLEALPNIGKSIAADLRAIGIQTPGHLARRKPAGTYAALAGQMGARHDPCVFYTLLSVEHFFSSGERLPWWKFTAKGQAALRPRDTAKGAR